MRARGSRGGVALRAAVAALACACASSLPAAPPFPLTPAQLSAASTTSPGNLHSAAVSSTGVAYTWGIGGQWLGYGMDAVALANLATYSEANNVATRNSGNSVYSYSRVVAGSLVSAQQGIGNGLGNSIPILQVSVGVATGTGASNTYQGTTGGPGTGMYASYAGHTLALLEDGRAVAFGRGSQGQMGVGSLSTPFLQDGLESSLDGAVVQGLNDYNVVAVAAGPTHSCFLMSTVRPCLRARPPSCWLYAASGRLLAVAIRRTARPPRTPPPSAASLSGGSLSAAGLPAVHRLRLQQ